MEFIASFSCSAILLFALESNFMNDTSQSEFATTVAARVAGEDIALGDFVAVTSEVIEFPSWFWSCSSATLDPNEPVRVQFLSFDAGQPYKVIGVCLPFVYGKSHCGEVVVMDTRRRRLVRLDRTCARAVWKDMKAIRDKNSK